MADIISTLKDGGEMVAPTVTITTLGGDEVDWSGINSMRIRLQLGAADECELTIQAQDQEGGWRPDLPVWQVGATLAISAGYDGSVALLQNFEIVSTTNTYGGHGEAPTMTVRGTSDLARAARNRNPKTFADKDDSAVLDAICAEYGWKNGVSTDAIAGKTLDLQSKFTKGGRVKAGGTTDLELLKTLAADALLGGPRLDNTGTLIMPQPSADAPIVFIRGAGASGDVQDALFADFYALLGFSPSREGGADNIQLSIVAWDPEQKKFIEKVYEADEFGGDPKIIYSGPLATAPVSGETSTRGLTVQVIVARGWNKDERRDVIASGRYLNETDAEALAKRWFDLRERLGRWATLEVEGHPALAPYNAVVVDGDMAKMDKGYWLPTVVEHNFGDDGWTTRLTSVRVVEDSTVTEAAS